MLFEIVLHLFVLLRIFSYVLQNYFRGLQVQNVYSIKVDEISTNANKFVESQRITFFPQNVKHILRFLSENLPSSENGSMFLTIKTYTLTGFSQCSRCSLRVFSLLPAFFCQFLGWRWIHYHRRNLALAKSCSCSRFPVLELAKSFFGITLSIICSSVFLPLISTKSFNSEIASKTSKSSFFVLLNKL